MLKRWRSIVVFLGLLLIAGQTVAQIACPALIQDALQSLSTSCGAINRNQVCYGNLSLHATLRSNTPTFTFDSVGDILDVMQLDTLKLEPLDEARGVWGMAMMRLQADIPDTLPGQNVTFLLFGDVEIENASADDQAPMQAFYIRSGLGEAACADAPENGVLIQTPDGVKSVHFRINGVDVEIGSTVMLQAQPEGALQIRTLEGAAVVTMAGQAYPVIAGTQMSLPMDAQLQPAGLPSIPVPLSDIDLSTLPVAPLPRAIPPAEPLSPAVTMKLQMRVKEGLTPCGVPGLPDCVHALEPQEQRVWASEDAYQEPENTSTPDPFSTPVSTAEAVDPQSTHQTGETESQPTVQAGSSTNSTAATPSGADPVFVPTSVPPTSEVSDAPATDPAGGAAGDKKDKKDKKDKDDKKDKKDKEDHPGGNPPPPAPPAPGPQNGPPPPPPGPGPQGGPPPAPPAPETNPPAPPPPSEGPGPGPDKPGHEDHGDKGKGKKDK